MDDKITLLMTNDPTDYEAALSQIYQEIDALLAQIREDQTEIDRLKAKSRLTSEDTQQMLALLKKAS